MYKQGSGGPIGARSTMAAGRLVMQDWGEEMGRCLRLSRMELLLLTGFVDDVRSGGTSIRFGLRFEVELGEWRWSNEAYMEDVRLREEGEDRDRRMVRLCLPICNSINPDLEFTAETASDFGDNRLPTLDFSIWLENRMVNHSFYQKPMKTSLQIMKGSAVSQHQKIQILANDIVRKLSNVNVGYVPEGEIGKVMEENIQELKLSGYSRREVIDITCSGLTGWKRKISRREKSGEGMYRPAGKTIVGRCKKKLLAKTNLYKARRKRGREDEEEEDLGERKKRRGNKERSEEEKLRREKRNWINPKAKAVMFLPYTHNSQLAKNMREAESKLLELTGYQLKVVERCGMKLEDLLRKSDPWVGMDCLRETCLHCRTKEKCKDIRKQSCTKRNLVYEIWCMECEEKDIRRIEERADGDEKRKKDLMEKMRVFKYIGETNRSVFERAYEHSKGIESLNSDSFMLKHSVDKHEGEKLNGERFGVKVLQYTRTSFERQILESVKIQENKEHHLLNSKSEYNRCAIPRLTSKIGEKMYKEWREDEKMEKEEEMRIEEKIRMLRKERNRERQREREQKEKAKEKDLQPVSKKRKVAKSSKVPKRKSAKVGKDIGYKNYQINKRMYPIFQIMNTKN